MLLLAVRHSGIQHRVCDAGSKQVAPCGAVSCSHPTPQARHSAAQWVILQQVFDLQLLVIDQPALEGLIKVIIQHCPSRSLAADVEERGRLPAGGRLRSLLLSRHHSTGRWRAAVHTLKVSLDRQQALCFS